MIMMHFSPTLVFGRETVINLYLGPQGGKDGIEVFEMTVLKVDQLRRMLGRLRECLLVSTMERKS